MLICFYIVASSELYELFLAQSILICCDKFYIKLASWQQQQQQQQESKHKIAQKNHHTKVLLCTGTTETNST